MYNSFFKFYIPIILIFLAFSLLVLFISNKSKFVSPLETEFYWPLPGNKNITSPFGRRTSPTSGASSYHSGIDIGASENTPIYACFSGEVIFTGFKGAGGYTITVKNENIESSYCHVSPNFIFKIGDFVKKQEIVAHVGPKNVYGISNNPYKDSSGNPTNGATTGCHLHLTIKKDGKAVNPLSFFQTNL